MTTSLPTLFVCTNCPKEAKQPTGIPDHEGDTLLEILTRRVAESPLSGTVCVQRVKCMGGCDTPCDIAFVEEGKESLLFGHMTTRHADDILTCLTQYLSNPKGHRLMKNERPESMQQNLMVRIPTAVVLPPDTTTT